MSTCLPQERGTLDFNVLVIDRNGLDVSQVGKYTVDGFQPEPEIAPNLLLRHRQPELCSREAAHGKPLGEAEQEYGDTLLCTHGSKQKHGFVIARDFRAHDAVEMVLQCRD